MPLEKYLEEKVFANCKCSTINPDKEDVEGFEKYMKTYVAALEAEKAAYKNC